MKIPFHGLRYPTTSVPRMLLVGIFTGLMLSVGPLQGEILREGDPVGERQLIAEDGGSLSLVDPQRQTLLTFIFTRCAAMEFCPRMTAQFAELQKEIKESGIEDLRMVSVSMDPEYDRPDKLKIYADAVQADPAIWRFGTGSTGEIDALLKDFRVHRDRSGGVLNHTLCTALVGTDGQIQAIWRGNAWKPEEILEAAKKP